MRRMVMYEFAHAACGAHAKWPLLLITLCMLSSQRPSVAFRSPSTTSPHVSYYSAPVAPIRAASPSISKSLIKPKFADVAQFMRNSQESPMRIDENLKTNQFVGKIAFFFPGQGSQMVNMGVETAERIPSAHALYTKASEILGYDLLQVCKEGPKQVLDSTAIAQPAILVCSMAALEKLKFLRGEEEVNRASVALGLSLGEYSALCYSGVLSFEDSVHITKERGAAMQAASDNTDTAMVAVLGLSKQEVEALCKRTTELASDTIIIANYLCKGNYVVSGSTKACDMLEKIAKPEFKALKTVRLAVSGAFHTPYMQPAADRLKAVIDQVVFNPASVPIISNVDGKAHTDPGIIKDLLLKQLTSPVYWEDSVNLVLQNGFESGYELGPGTTLSGILKRIDKTKSLEAIM